MKKLALIVCMASFLGLTACNQCTTCTFHWDEGSTAKSAEQDQVCGTKKDIKDYKGGLQSAVETLAATIGGTNAYYTCVDE